MASGATFHKLTASYCAAAAQRVLSKLLTVEMEQASRDLRSIVHCMEMYRMPSMAEAAQIRDVAARHEYVFDNGLSSPDFFDVEKRMASEEFEILRRRIDVSKGVLEVGCFTGLNLIGLAILGCNRVAGIDFVRGAVQWCHDEAVRRGYCVMAGCSTFPPKDEYNIPRHKAPQIICFDVLEHQRNVGQFLDGVDRALAPDGRAFFLVPKGREYYDCGHVAFFPDAECLHNVLDYVFEVDELFELKTCKKLFASCRRRS